MTAGFPCLNVKLDLRGWSPERSVGFVDDVQQWGGQDISAAGRRAEISELEMELLASSDPLPLFDLAIDLATELALYPASASKALALAGS